MRECGGALGYELRCDYWQTYVNADLTGLHMTSIPAAAAHALPKRSRLHQLPVRGAALRPL